MKLFIWKDPYKVAYGGSSVHAVAKNVVEARKIACSAKAVTMSYGRVSREQNDWSAMQLGEPTEVIDLPCAVWDSWSE